MAREHVELRRARPLLGTYVELRVRGLDRDAATRACERAFAAVGRVQECMSPFAPASDVARINRAIVGQPVSIDPWTWTVLATARFLSTQSDGAFDVTVPAQAAAKVEVGNWSHVDLGSACQVVCRAGLQINLGGIAKGFAVDRAVSALQAAGATGGVVNAGGDLRAFGSGVEEIVVRHPVNAGALIPLGRLANGAVATSANTLDLPGAGRLQRRDGGTMWLGGGSVTVAAPTCMVADALTKIVAARGLAFAASMLRRWRATAVVVRPNGSIESSNDEVPHAA